MQDQQWELVVDPLNIGKELQRAWLAEYYQKHNTVQAPNAQPFIQEY